MASDQEEVSSYFKEKQWGKEDGNVYIIDGYTFRGKRMFNKAWEGLKIIMKREYKTKLEK
jgi:hypothetical protein